MIIFRIAFPLREVDHEFSSAIAASDSQFTLRSKEYPSPTQAKLCEICQRKAK
jgi:hypothetical protein